MSCWVVPSVAAEVWDMDLSKVMQAIHDGTAVSKTENGLQMVDVAPHGREICRPDQCPHKRPSVTSDEVSDEELALLGASDDDADTSPLNWRRGRVEASFRRKAPGTFPLLKAA
jgi:hypothetical protein